MGKLYSIKIIGLITGFLCCVTTMQGQNSLMVFKVNGSPILKVNDSLKSVSKGSQVTYNATLSLKGNDDILLINQKGNCFKIDVARDYQFTEILKHPVAEDNSSFTKKYFSYVWNQMVNSSKSKTKAGVVFRIDNIILLQPNDSVKINIPEIKFVWNIEAEESFFILRDVETDHISKFGVDGKSLTLFIDNEVLKRGKRYQWAVSATKFPNLEEVEFYNFSLLTSVEFKALKPDIEVFKKEMTAMGFTSAEIRLMLCNDYKICY